MLFTLENEFLSVKFNSFGAVFDSIFSKKYNEELLWQGDIKSWQEKDITIFPFPGRLKDGYYYHNNIKYNMRIHGIANYYDFSASKKEKQVSFILKSNKDTLKEFPFDFEFIVTYTLQNNIISKAFTVTNFSNENMPFCVGGHPGFILDGVENEETVDTKDNFILFDKEQSLQKIVMDESNVFVKGTEQTKNTNKLNLKKGIFSKDALIYKNFLGDITLFRKNGIKIRFHLNSPPYLALWSHKKYGSYVAVEPWWGLPDSNPPMREWAEKKLVTLAPNQVFNYTFSAEIL